MFPDWLEKTEALKDNFFCLCIDGNFEALTELLKGGYDIETKKVHYNQIFTPLSWAVYFDEIDVVKFLVRSGSSIHIPDFDVGIEYFLKGNHRYSHPTKGNIIDIAKLNDNKEMINYLSSVLKKQEAKKEVEND